MLGELPQNEADEVLKLTPAIQPVKPHLLTPETTSKTATGGAVSDSSRGDDDFQRAMQESQRLQQKMEEEELQAVLAMSMSSGQCKWCLL